ncbi:hypothetical protein ABZZ20_20685 [Streptomyces sp. NPDC006430]|uniref:hypothetical protein n=1 Tax=Streptomyces sp. NPDC006430 TaxID=3154299 RepID=UPI0033BB39B8
MSWSKRWRTATAPCTCSSALPRGPSTSPSPTRSTLDEFAAAGERIAAADLDFVTRRQRPEELVERVVVGTVLGDAMLAALRRLAQVDASARRYSQEAADSSSG